MSIVDEARGLTEQVIRITTCPICHSQRDTEIQDATPSPCLRCEAMPPMVRRRAWHDFITGEIIYRHGDVSTRLTKHLERELVRWAIDERRRWRAAAAMDKARREGGIENHRAAVTALLLSSLDSVPFSEARVLALCASFIRQGRRLSLRAVI